MIHVTAEINPGVITCCPGRREPAYVHVVCSYREGALSWI
jgi:hypothetical protein